MFADSPDVLPLNRLARPSDKPVPGPTSEENCPDEGGFILAGSRVVGTARVTLLHQCGASDEEGAMSLKVGDAYFVSIGTVIHYTGANMTDAPEHLSLVSDRVIAGTLADGSTAVVHAVTTHSEMIYWKTGQLDSETYNLHTEVCSLDPAPACVTAETVECSARGCPAPTLSRGTLRIVDRARKAHVRKVERVANPQPPL